MSFLCSTTDVINAAVSTASDLFGCSSNSTAVSVPVGSVASVADNVADAFRKLWMRGEDSGHRIEEVGDIGGE